MNLGRAILAGVVVLLLVYAATLLRLTADEGYSEVYTEEVHGMRSRIGKLEEERLAQRHVIADLVRELNQTRADSLTQLQAIQVAIASTETPLPAEIAPQKAREPTLDQRHPPVMSEADPQQHLPLQLSGGQPVQVPPPKPPAVRAPPPRPPPPSPTPGLKLDSQSTTLQPGAALSTAEDADPEIAHKRTAVREAMLHSWGGYKKFGWGFDELQPVSRRGKNWLNSGATIIDALSTLKVMGLQQEFDEAATWVKAHDFSHSGKVSFFETTIRDLGGLLSSYDLSGDRELLTKAQDLGDRLLAAFAVSPLGIPTPQVDLGTGETAEGWLGHSSLLAEMGTIQLEFRQLSHYTGDTKYAEKADHVSHLLEEMHPTHGLWPCYIDRSTGAFSGQHLVTFGGMGDSMYEYLLKGWLQTAKQEEWLWEMYRKAMDGMHEVLLQQCDGRSYVADLKSSRLDHKMDHLVCFVPGMLALGVANRPDAPTAERDLQTAKALMATCIEMYTMQPTGLAPEFSRFSPAGGGGGNCKMFNGANQNLLRPEALESMFILWRVTKDPQYREHAWTVFQAFNRFARVESGGFSGLKDVTDTNSELDDTQQTFWLAETLKYLYLIFSPDDLIPLDKYVFNTEAHPLLIWTP